MTEKTLLEQVKVMIPNKFECVDGGAGRVRITTTVQHDTEVNYKTAIYGYVWQEGDRYGWRYDNFGGRRNQHKNIISLSKAVASVVDRIFQTAENTKTGWDTQIHNKKIVEQQKAKLKQEMDILNGEGYMFFELPNNNMWPRIEMHIGETIQSEHPFLTPRAVIQGWYKATIDGVDVYEFNVVAANNYGGSGLSLTMNQMIQLVNLFKSWGWVLMKKEGGV